MGALAQKKNKASLRNLSIILRQTGKGTSQSAAVAESVERAKEATTLDVADGSVGSMNVCVLAIYVYMCLSPVPVRLDRRACIPFSPPPPISVPV